MAKVTLDVAMKKSRHLFEQLWSSKPDGADEPPASPITFFMHPKLGGVRLSGRVAELFEECVDILPALHTGDPELRPLSRSASKQMLQRAALAALGIRSSKRLDRRAFEGRRDRALRRLRAALKTPPSEWEVTIQVRGIAAGGLPVNFGGVAFSIAPEALGETLIKSTVGSTRRVTKHRAAEVENGNAQTAKEIHRIFNGHPIATVNVLAMDDEAARKIGIDRIRRTVDTINFFAPFTHERPRAVHRAFVAPEGERLGLPRVVRPVTGENFFWSAGGSNVRPIAVEDPASDRATQIGMRRADELLRSSSRSDFDARILTALSWGGRATVESTREMGFLLFAIALEALLTNARPGAVTRRLQLRVSHLIGRDSQSRKEIGELLDGLYRLRSRLVHSGEASDVTEHELATLAAVVRGALVTVLTQEPFVAMTSARAFEEWLDDRVYG